MIKWFPEVPMKKSEFLEMFARVVNREGIIDPNLGEEDATAVSASQHNILVGPYYKGEPLANPIISSVVALRNTRGSGKWPDVVAAEALFHAERAWEYYQERMGLMRDTKGQD